MIYEPKTAGIKMERRIRAFTNLRPVPQPGSWESFAAMLASEGALAESCFVLESAAKYYPTRSIAEALVRVTKIPAKYRGVSLTEYTPAQDVRFGAPNDGPQALGFYNGYVYFIAGTFLIIASPTYGTRFSIPLSKSPIESATICGTLVYFISEGVIYTTDIAPALDAPQDYSKIDDEEDDDDAGRKRLVPERHDIGECAKKMCGPTDDGHILVTCRPDMAVFSDKCISFRHDLPPRLLSNTQQTLTGDCRPNGQFWLTCGGGMQKHETRLIRPDGSWRTKFIHETDILGIVYSESGPVSIDKSGNAYLWSGTSIIDDLNFDLSPLPKINASTAHMHICWTDRRLYANYGQSCTCIGADGSTSIYPTLYPIAGQTRYMAAIISGRIYLWDMSYGAVPPQLQLTRSLASEKSWISILADSPYDAESDPRVFWVK